jgi:phospholipid/cholesterol/gamma-HCH transport system substrate-binding protein
VLRIKPETAVGLFLLIAIGIFFYMSIAVGSLRLNKGYYKSYILYFNDIAGLNKKADVKIAGVKVGWVDTIELLIEQQQVRATIMINKEYTLRSDAYGTIRQEGLLGTKFLEINPGTAHAPIIENNSTLLKAGRETASFDQVLSQFRDMAQQIEVVSNSLNGALDGAGDNKQLIHAFNCFTEAIRHVSSFSQRLDTLVEQNQATFDILLTALKELVTDLRQQLPIMSKDAHVLIESLANSSPNFNRAAIKIETTAESLETIMHKIRDGKGVLGQLMNDDESYRDLQTTIQGLKNYFARFDKLAIVFDTHFESMHGVFDQRWFRDLKGYFNIRFHPSEDYFYLAGIVGTLSGTLDRYESHQRWFKDLDSTCDELIPGDLNLSDAQELRFAPLKQTVIRNFDRPTFNLQFGKIYRNMAMRFGVFESTIGVALDLDVPFDYEPFRWVSTFEIFDFRGRKRVDDDSPHLKWFNRLFITQNMYFVIGFDDFISKHNKNSFFGFALRFGDDDIKYVFPQVNISV